MREIIVFGIHWEQDHQTEKKIAYTFVEIQVLHLILLGLKLTVFPLCPNEQAI